MLIPLIINLLLVRLLIKNVRHRIENEKATILIKYLTKLISPICSNSIIILPKTNASVISIAMVNCPKYISLLYPRNFFEDILTLFTIYSSLKSAINKPITAKYIAIIT